MPLSCKLMYGGSYSHANTKRVHVLWPVMAHRLHCLLPFSACL